MSKFNQIALFDRIVVQIDEAANQTSSGLYTAEKVKPTQGKVVAVGPGKLSKTDTFIPTTVAIGDVVVFVAGSGKQIRIEGQEYLILQEQEILAILVD